jgi:hypothetical protein
VTDSTSAPHRSDVQLGALAMRLGPYPALGSVLQAVLERLVVQPEVNLIVAEGSLAAGTLDAYSDLDLAIQVKATSESLHLVEERLVSVVADSGRLVARFAATHLHLPNLHVFLFDLCGEIVKVDVKIAAPWDPIDISHVLLLYGDSAAAAVPESRGSGSFDFYLAEQRFIGWTWYTYTKLARGEVLEAISSLAVIRDQVLVPCLQVLYGLPHEGYRRLEWRLDGQDIAALRGTFSRSQAKEDVLRALAATVALYQRLARGRATSVRSPAPGAALDLVVARIQRDEPTFFLDEHASDGP